MRRTVSAVFVAFTIAATLPPGPAPHVDAATERTTASLPAPELSPAVEPAWTDTALALSYDGPPPTTLVEPPAAAPSTSADTPIVVTGTVRDRALSTLIGLGAQPWQVGIFDCIGWRESGWQSIRSKQRNPNGTYDHGPFQINDVHWPQLNAQGLDPYIPEHAAIYAWQLSRQGTRFSPTWSVAPSCGV